MRWNCRAACEANAEFIKIYLPAGEIDIVVVASLLARPFEVVTHAGRKIRVESCAEIMAKKMWHRGHRGKTRDLFDLRAVADAEPQAIKLAAPFIRRHGAEFLHQLSARPVLREAEGRG